MKRAVELVVRNLMLTVAVLMACVVLGYVVGAIAGAILYAPGALSPLGGPLNERDRALLQAGVRGSYVSFATWVGLAASQVVFLVWHLEPGARGNGAAGSATPINRPPTGGL